MLRLKAHDNKSRKYMKKKKKVTKEPLQYFVNIKEDLKKWNKISGFEKVIQANSQQMKKPYNFNAT